MSAADVFRKMLNTFMPNQPLQGDALERYYVERPHAPLEPMKECAEGIDRAVPEDLFADRAFGGGRNGERVSTSTRPGALPGAA